MLALAGPLLALAAVCEIAGQPVMADITGAAPASGALQRCLDLAPSPWTVPPGTYRIDQSLSIRRPLAIAGSGATWRADVGLKGIERARGMVYGARQKGVEIRGLTLDGNGDERRARGPAFCDGTAAAGNGANIHLDNVEDVVLEEFTSKNAVCGSGMNLRGKNVRVLRSTFSGNGTHEKPRMWADGLTLLQCERCLVEGNTFADNSDIGFIFGGGEGTRVAGNRIVQNTRAFAGLMLDDFNATRSGDFRGVVVENNTIECRAHQCDFGINLGPHAWYLSGPIRGGAVINNLVRGAKIGINAQGAGTAEQPVEVRGNRVFRRVPDGVRAAFQCGERPVYRLLKSADSHLATDNDAWTVGDHKLCP